MCYKSLHNIDWEFVYVLVCDLIREVIAEKWTKIYFKVVEYLVSFSDMQQLLHASK